MDKIKNLVSKIITARNDYYNNDPKVSDAVFDAWIDELKILDPNNAAITSIGSPIVQSEWKKANHQIPMGSLDKVNTPTELEDWASVANGNKLCVMEKLDGISIEVLYENGEIVQAITRGNGYVGEDITTNVVNMQGAIKSLDNFTGSLRGEIIMTRSVHKQHFTQKANPRNAASGIAKRLDGVGSEHLTILFYQAIGDIEFKTETEQLSWLRSHKIQTPNYWLMDDHQEVSNHWRQYQDKTRATLDYDIDGLVVRIDDMTKQLSLGDKDLRPKGAIAFKFDNELLKSTIKGFIWQTGNSGRITPVAIVDPVILSGAKVERASVYNMAYINSLGLDVGAVVLITRANDVIPRIEETVVGTGTVVVPPSICPTCSAPTAMIGENLSCTNSLNCQAQIAGRLKNWVAELNLLEWGDTLLERLSATGKVVTVADLYKLTVADLEGIERMGAKSAKKCLDILWKDIEIPLNVFLGALSIPMIGQSTIKLIMNEGCDTLEKFGQLKAAQFEEVPGVGPIKAQSLEDGLITYQQVILDLLNNGVKIKQKIVGSLTGKSICFSGSFPNYKKSELEKMAEQAGADVKSSSGKSLSYLVLADSNSTSSKAVAARKNNTTVIDENDFLKMIGK